MLEYLKGYFRQRTAGEFVHHSPNAPIGSFPQPVIGLCRRLSGTGYHYISQANGVQYLCEVRILCIDGLEYSYVGEVLGSGIEHLQDYLENESDTSLRLFLEEKRCSNTYLVTFAKKLKVTFWGLFSSFTNYLRLLEVKRT